MNLETLYANNALTLTALRNGSAQSSAHPYFGYFTADIFDCPPFIMFTNNDCPGSTSILYHRQFEMGSLRLWCALAKSASSVIDIGANVGIYSLTVAALRSDIPIHAFEPNPHAFARLRLNKSVNNFLNINERQDALGHIDNQPISLTWRAKPGHPISSGSAVGKKGATGPIETSIAVLGRLDSLSLGPIGDRCLIKIDVEGAETFVFQGMSATLNARPDIILESFDQRSCDAITETTRAFGYRYFMIDEKTNELTERSALSPCARTDSSFNQFLSVRPPP
jgi:FkbM family methyltransferase